MNLVEWSMALKGHLEAGETRGPNLYSRITAFAFLWGYAITTRTNRDAALLERQFRVSPGLVEREVQKAHSQAEATCNRLGLEFGVSGYRDTIEDLPFVVDRMERYRTRAASTFDAYGWKKI
jgi:hypothetical protein